MNGFALALLAFAIAEPAAKDTQRLLTKSPWAKEAVAQMNFSNMGGPGGPGGGGPGMGGPGGGGPGMGGPGMGGPGGGGPGMGGPGMSGPGGDQSPQIKAIVRWESAAPIRAALNRELPADAERHYVISVSGLPMTGQQGRRPPTANAPGGEDPRAQMRERMKASTSLQCKGRTIRPSRMQFSEDDGLLLFFFPQDDNPIKLADKEVTFTTRLGPLELKVKFTLKDMQRNGKLEL